MSNAYVVEPKTQGKVIMKTTYGDIEIELWAKEATKACRNFIQLALEGYYNDTIFHRISKNFVVQGGDRSGTGKGGESIFGHNTPFENEIHSRLRFLRRGMVATAVGGDQNNSQFFITLDKCENLNGKHTIFGRVSGDTIFNVLRMSELEVTEEERPKFPPLIKSIEVMWNPFNDLKIRNGMWIRKVEEKVGAKGRKDLSLLSFGDEAEQEDAIQVSKFVSRHETMKKANQETIKKRNLKVQKKVRDEEERISPQAPVSIETVSAPLTSTELPGQQLSHNKLPIVGQGKQEEIKQQSPTEPDVEKPKKQGGQSFGKDYLLQQREKYQKNRTTGKRRDKEREEKSLEKLASFTKRLKNDEDLVNHSLRFDKSKSLEQAEAELKSLEVIDVLEKKSHADE